jgi:hypothetical protein
MFRSSPASSPAARGEAPLLDGVGRDAQRSGGVVDLVERGGDALGEGEHLVDGERAEEGGAERLELGGEAVDFLVGAVELLGVDVDAELGQ